MVICLLLLQVVVLLHLIITVISGKSFSQYTLYSLIFSPLDNIINKGQCEKYLYNQPSHHGKYGMSDR